MTEYGTGAVRDTGGKGRCDLLPHSALLRVARHMENSLADHEERNWERGLPMHCFLDSAMRHVFKYMDGMVDEDHLAAAATNLLMALWTEDHLPDQQNIPTRPGCVSEGTGRPSEGRCGRGRADGLLTWPKDEGGRGSASDGGYLAAQR